MKCPECRRETRVVDSRETKHSGLRRRRQCDGCRERFSTIEVAAQDTAGLIRGLTAAPVTDQKLYRLQQALDEVRLAEMFPFLEALAKARFLADVG
jgi:transcriptional regulator NrdR family protein